jgi:hypothetical protein
LPCGVRWWWWWWWVTPITITTTTTTTTTTTPLQLLLNSSQTQWGTMWLCKQALCPVESEVAYKVCLVFIWPSTHVFQILKFKFLYLWLHVSVSSTIFRPFQMFDNKIGSKIIKN